jgi:hypothetical protein
LRSRYARHSSSPAAGRKTPARNPARAEFCVEKDRTVTITFYDAALKPVPVVAQAVTVIADAKVGKAKIEFEKKGDVFEVALNATSMFNHSNVRMPQAIERVLRWLLVTPDMHRVHHSILRRETDSNFGFNFPWWDRLFRTYRPLPEAGHETMTLGIEQFRDPKELRIDWMLAQPFRHDENQTVK